MFKANSFLFHLQGSLLSNIFIVIHAGELKLNLVEKVGQAHGATARMGTGTNQITSAADEPKEDMGIKLALIN